MNGEAHHAHHNLQKAITIYDTDRQPVEDDDHTYYSEAGKLETVVETDETFDLDNTFSETFHSSNSQNTNFNKDAITQAAIRRRRRFVTCMSVMPLLVSLIALVSLLSQNSQKEEEDVVYLNETNNNATITSSAEDTIDIVGETSTDQSTTYNSVAKTRSPSSSSPTPNPTKSPSLSPTTKNVSLCSVAFEMGAVHLIRENREHIYHKYMTCGTRHVSHVIPSFVYHFCTYPLFLSLRPAQHFHVAMVYVTKIQTVVPMIVYKSILCPQITSRMLNPMGKCLRSKLMKKLPFNPWIL